MIHLDNTPPTAPRAQIENHFQSLPSRCNRLSLHRIKDLCIYWISLPFSTTKYAHIVANNAPADRTETAATFTETAQPVSEEGPLTDFSIQSIKDKFSIKKNSFKDLECTAADKEKITRLISILGETKLLFLWPRKNELTQLGHEIAHVHPLEIFRVIFADPYLTDCLKKIYSSSIKWSHFMSKEDEGFGKSLTELDQQGRVSIFLSDFAKSVGVKLEDIQEFAKNQEWSEMIVYILYTQRT